MNKLFTNNNFNKIVCVGFSKDVVWSFHPQILEGELLQFIKDVNAKRNFPLKSKRGKRKNSTYIQNDIKSLITI